MSLSVESNIDLPNELSQFSFLMARNDVQILCQTYSNHSKVARSVVLPMEYYTIGSSCLHQFGSSHSYHIIRLHSLRLTGSWIFFSNGKGLRTKSASLLSNALSSDAFAAQLKTKKWIQTWPSIQWTWSDKLQTGFSLTFFATLPNFVRPFQYAALFTALFTFSGFHINFLYCYYSVGLVYPLFCSYVTTHSCSYYSVAVHVSLWSTTRFLKGLSPKHKMKRYFLPQVVFLLVDPVASTRRLTFYLQSLNLIKTLRRLLGIPFWAE